MEQVITMTRDDLNGYLGIMFMGGLLLGLLVVAIFLETKDITKGDKPTAAEQKVLAELEALRAAHRINLAAWQAREEMRTEAQKQANAAPPEES